MKFVSIAIFIYVLTMQNDSPTNLLCFIFLGLFIVLIITELIHYNTVQIDIKNQVITICPNIILYFVISKKIIEFEKITKIIVTSNINSSGFLMAYRRYYLTLILKKSEKIKIISSSKHERAFKISELLTSVLQ
jgi:hypothetical protein